MAHLKHEEKELIRLYALGEEFSEQDSLKLQRVLDTVAEARDELDKHRRFKNLMTQGKNHALPAGFIDETMRRVSSKKAPSSSVQDKRFRFPTWVWPSPMPLRLAYLSLVVALLTGYFYLVSPRTIYVAPGEQQSVLLADQTEVIIGSGSSLRVFPSPLRSKRKVILKGEAFFNVQPGEKPFVVETFNTIVTVKGTQFNVRAHPNRINQRTEVSVQEGLVEVVSPELPEKAISLEAGQGTQVHGSKTAPNTKKSVVIEQVINWKSGGFAFENEPLLGILDDLERRFAITISAPAHLHELQSSYFNNAPATADEVLEAICESLNLTYRTTDVGYEVLDSR